MTPCRCTHTHTHKGQHRNSSTSEAACLSVWVPVWAEQPVCCLGLILAVQLYCRVQSTCLPACLLYAGTTSSPELLRVHHLPEVYNAHQQQHSHCIQHQQPHTVLVLLSRTTHRERHAQSAAAHMLGTGRVLCGCMFGGACHKVILVC